MLADVFSEIHEYHESCGYVDYLKYPYLYNACQTHFYQKEIMLGTTKFDVVNKHRWQAHIDWTKIYTDKWVKSYYGQPGSIDVNDMIVKDRYYDYAKACIPYAEDPDLFDMVKEAIFNNNLNVYIKKPPAMVYMVGAIENKNNENFVKYYNLMLKNLNKLQELG